MSTNAPQTKTDRRIVKTKAAIENALIRLLKEKDLSKITISAIALEADINRKTFYLHYSSVNELFDEIISNRIMNIIKDLQCQHRENPTEFLLADIATHLCLTLHHSAQNYPEIYQHIPLVHVFNLALDPLSDAIIKERRQENLAEIENLEYYLRFAFAGAFSVYHNWLAEKTDLSADEIALIIRKAIASSIGDLL